MSITERKKIQATTRLEKVATGISGFDELTDGGLPKGRPTLVCGTAGCGKTLFSMEFLIHGARKFKEPGVFVTFEETKSELSQNMLSLGFDLDELIRQKLLLIDYVRVERSEIDEVGEYNLEGLFIRLAYAIDSIHAKRVVLDTIESLFAGFNNASILRAELRRLFRWLKERGLTVIVTGESNEHSLTRQGLEEYVSDCVVYLEQHLTQNISTRRLRVVKYRGSYHGTNEYPFVIDEDGIALMPITSLALDLPASNERILTGVPSIDSMLDGNGFFRGSCALVTGGSGTGKTTLAAQFIDAACARDESCLLFLFEESSAQLIRNLHSIGINLATWVEKGTLHIHAARSTLYGLEMHFAKMNKLIKQMRPQVIAIDPVTNLFNVGSALEVRLILTLLIDLFKSQQITVLLTSLSAETVLMEQYKENISSLVDTWFALSQGYTNGVFQRDIQIIKSRGMLHSSQKLHFQISDHGIEITNKDCQHGSK